MDTLQSPCYRFDSPRPSLYSKIWNSFSLSGPLKGFRSFPSTKLKARRCSRKNYVRAIATEPRRPDLDTSPGIVKSRSPGITPSMRVGDMSEEFKKIRAQMEEDEQLASLMRGLRGQNLSDSLFAADDVQLRLVEVSVPGDKETLPLVYNPDTISSYWGKRPQAVFTRMTQLLSVAGGFLSHLIWDIVTNKLKENEVARAIELREIVTSLGPAYIKLGQALSIRPDILSPAAMTELQKLCDKVPSFPDDLAMALIEEELGRPWTEIYSELSPSPIAAASLGQVYKGCLRENGDLVAVKVQRPFVLETVTVDLFIIRKLGLALRKFPKITIDVVGLVDEWAARFFEELDYVNEGDNGTRFAEMMRRDLPQVVVPKTYSQYTSRKVITTGWVDGEKLSQSTAGDVGQLVNVGVICYLKQLLDTGLFHADPHPGNMIRTPDGKLAILDFASMLPIPLSNLEGTPNIKSNQLCINDLADPKGIKLQVIKESSNGTIQNPGKPIHIIFVSFKFNIQIGIAWANAYVMVIGDKLINSCLLDNIHGMLDRAVMFSSHIAFGSADKYALDKSLVVEISVEFINSATKDSCHRGKHAKNGDRVKNTTCSIGHVDFPTQIQDYL